MTPVHQQIEKLQQEMETLLMDSIARMEKERILFEQKLARIDAKIAALVDPPVRAKKSKSKTKDSAQLSLIA